MCAKCVGVRSFGVLFCDSLMFLVSCTQARLSDSMQCHRVGASLR